MGLIKPKIISRYCPFKSLPGQLAECAAKARRPPYVFPQSLHSTGGSSAAVLKQLSAAVLQKLLLFAVPGRLLVSSAAEEQEERQLRVPPAVAVLTAAAADDDASCSSKVGNFDKKKSANRSKISPQTGTIIKKNYREHFRCKQSKKMCAKTV
jgi:hypothetical protein